MLEEELSSAKFWSHVWESTSEIAFFVVVVALAVELAADHFVKPHREKIERVQADKVLELQHSNLALQETAETLRAKNLEVEKAIAPRTFEQYMTARELSGFASMHALVVSPIDFEPRRTAGQIRWMLFQNAGWRRFDRPVELPNLFSDGVVVRTIAGPDSSQAREAAQYLVKVLNEQNIVARTGAPVGDPFGPLDMLIEVGAKPLPESLKYAPRHPDPEIRQEFGNTME